jgi:hypothetical protein
MVDGISGSVTTYAISGMETAAPTTSGLSAGLQIRGLGNAASTVGGSPSGVSAGGSAVTAGAGAIGLDSSDLSQFQANVTSGGSQVAANWKAIIYLGCQLLTGGDPNIGTNPIEPVTPPAPITQSCSAAGGKKAGA